MRDIETRSFDMRIGVEHNSSSSLFCCRRHRRHHRPLTRGSVHIILLEFHYNTDNAQLARRLLSLWITSQIIVPISLSFLHPFSSPPLRTGFLLNVKINRTPRARKIPPPPVRKKTITTRSFPYVSQFLVIQ